MSVRLEQLRRQWIEQRDTVAKEQYVREMLSCGRVSSERLRFAATIGDPIASLLCHEFTPRRDGVRSIVSSGSVLLTLDEAIRFALACAEKVSNAWRSVFPVDTRPIDALKEVETWLQGGSTEAALRQIAELAEAASLEKDDGFLPEDDLKRARAINAADAAWHTAFAAALAANPDTNHEELGRTIGFVAAFTRDSFDNTELGEKWVFSKLSDYLLGLSTSTVDSD